MPTVDLVVESPVSTSTRARQVCSMFDVPPQEKARLAWSVTVPALDEPWNVGLIVGPSGSGKSSVMRRVYGDMPRLAWGAPSVVDDFPRTLSVQQITEACGAVGFNTIPAWLRPFAVLSNGEQFRVDLARRLVELSDPIVVDEFTSVVDRQVAQIGAHAVQKFVRRTGRRFVAVTCHYDVIDWLQPDWVLDMATQSYTRRLLQRRPPIECVVGRVPRAAWAMFAPYHYLTATIHQGSQCFGLWVGGRLVTFLAALHRPHPIARGVMGGSRVVTLPDWQGLGLAMVLCDAVGAAYKGVGKRFRPCPAHPSFVRAFDRSPLYTLDRRPGEYDSTPGRTTTQGRAGGVGRMVSRPAAVFEYVGPAMPRDEAERLIGGEATA